MKFCSTCGDRVILTDVDGDTHKRYVCTNCKTIHYTNPKLVVGALVYWEDKVILCRRAIEPRLGFWNIPAGYLEDHEKAEEGAAREVWEEAGAKVNIEGVLAIYNLPEANQVYIHFIGELIDGVYSNGVESIETKLFSEEEIPWKDLAFTSSAFALRKYFQDRKQGKIGTYIGSFPQTGKANY
ncbi:MAG: NUDIX hydrolase [Chitinophagales bacterium]|nr:NUDIX hydrolase [Chitinophagales bacterium]